MALEPETLPLNDLTVEQKRQLLIELKEARFSAASRIKFKERDVTFRSDLELRRAIEDLEKDLDESAPGPRKRRQRVAFTTFSRGR